MLLKKSVETNKTFSSKKLEWHIFIIFVSSLPTGVHSSPISFSCSSRKASWGDWHIAWVQLTLSSSPVPPESRRGPGLLVPVAGGRRAQEGSRALRSSTPVGSLPGSVALGIVPQAWPGHGSPGWLRPSTLKSLAEACEGAEVGLLPGRLCNLCSRLHKCGE